MPCPMGAAIYGVYVNSGSDDTDFNKPQPFTEISFVALKRGFPQHSGANSFRRKSGNGEEKPTSFTC